MASYLCVCVTVLRLYPNTTFTSETEGVSRSVCPALCDPIDLPGSSDQSRIYLLQEIFPTQESNQGLLHCRWILYKLSYQGSPAAAAAAAKLLQSCPTLCNPIDGSPSGSTVPGIFQARTLKQVAISFSNA